MTDDIERIRSLVSEMLQFLIIIYDDIYILHFGFSNLLDVS